MVTAKHKIIISLALLIALIIPGVSAVVLKPEMVDMNKTITYADLGLTGQQNIQIWVGQNLVETGNTSGVEILYQPIGDYTVVIKPELGNRWLNNPALFLTDAVDYLLAFAFPLFLILGFIAAATALAGYGQRH